MDFTPLFYVSKSSERFFLLLISGLLLAVSVIAAITTIRYIDIPIFLLLLI
jgi:hypothetical protein